MAPLSAAPVNATTSDIRMRRLASAAPRLTGLAGHSQSRLSALQLMKDRWIYPQRPCNVHLLHWARPLTLNRAEVSSSATEPLILMMHSALAG